ncbi:MAG: DNA topoisomerase III [Ruminococcaceae bacterium]|nr:DNA topoisomerase III [Oscillospiraceae bacterium]
MAKTLVLAEKPSVARDIARVLGCKGKGDGCINGDKYVVTWALGHLVTLADPDAYDDKYKAWRLEDLPMLPDKMKLVTIKQTSKQYRIVSALMKRPDIDKLVIATDAGREGELVARWIMMKAHCKLPAYRLWISSQTDKAIREGFQNLRSAKEYDNLYYSAQARAEADWLVGLNTTRALTCKYNASLSAGRVQTPTLAMIVQREEEIQSFVPKTYYTLKGDFGAFKATYRDGKGNTRFSDKDFAESLYKSLQGRNYSVTKLEKATKRQNPPAAYDLTELQRDANKKYGYSAKQTLSLMQSLYEYHKVLTYPRTDSRYITDDIVATLPERLRAMAVGPYQASAMRIARGKIETKYIVNNAKVSDHHAIIPTEQSPNLSKLSYEERNIYDLVVRRFMAVLSEPFEYDEVKVEIAADKGSFFAKGKTPLKQGWKEFYGNLDDDEDDDSDDKAQSLPPLKQGQALTLKGIKITEGKTKPPARYTEATLLSAMENPSKQITDKTLKAVIETTSGLGTPATRADIIEKLFDNFSIERVGKEIHPTAKGKQLVKIVPEDLKSATLTAKWEQQLQNISKGKQSMKTFIGEMREYSTSLVSKVIVSDAQYNHENATKDKCPVCGKYLLEVNGKKGKMLICQDRECGYRKGLTQVTNARCPECHKKLELRGEGDKKLFVCKCGYRERLSDFNKRKQDSGANKFDVMNYMKKQQKEEKGKPDNNPMADLLKDFF